MFLSSFVNQSSTQDSALPRKFGYATRYLDAQLHTGIYNDADFRKAFELAEACPARKAELERFMVKVVAGKPAQPHATTSFFNALSSRGEVNALQGAFGGAEMRALDQDKAVHLTRGMWRTVGRHSREAILLPHVSYLRNVLVECGVEHLPTRRV